MDNLFDQIFSVVFNFDIFFMKEIFCFSSSILGIILIYGEISKFNKKVYSSKLSILVYVMLIT